MEKYSKQKKEIYDFIKNANNHPTADEIYFQLNETSSRISRGTIYRNLNLLVEKNIIKRISIPNYPDRFEFICEDKHNYAVCLKCGKVYNFHYMLEKENLNSVISTETELTEFSDEFVIYGICNSCNKNKK